MVGARLSKLSCSTEEFTKVKPDYQEALKKSGYDQEIKYDVTSKKRRRRSRKIIWFNPPYNMNVKTNIGKAFLFLVKKHFPPKHKYRSLFNKNTIKLSYSCMENVEQIIKKHNAKILKSTKKVEPETRKNCNCQKASSCPMSGYCQNKCIVYRAEVKTSDSKKIYYGVCETTFKKRYSKHLKSFNHAKYKSETSLSKYIWKLKEQNKQYQIAWSTHGRANPYQCGSRRCSLCIAERLAIIKEDPSKLINERANIVSLCPHRTKYLLKNSQ